MVFKHTVHCAESGKKYFEAPRIDEFIEDTLLDSRKNTLISCQGIYSCLFVFSPQVLTGFFAAARRDTYKQNEEQLRIQIDQRLEGKLWPNDRLQQVQPEPFGTQLLSSMI